MSVLSNIVGGAAAKPIAAIGGALDALFTSDDERLSRKEALERLRMEPHRWQAEINQMQAQHRTIFVAGARPAAMWVCVFALAAGIFAKIIFPMFVLIMPLIGFDDLTKIKDVASHLQGINTDFYTPILLALLGLGGMRTYEKKNGVAK